MYIHESRVLHDTFLSEKKLIGQSKMIYTRNKKRKGGLKYRERQLRRQPTESTSRDNESPKPVPDYY